VAPGIDLQLLGLRAASLPLTLIVLMVLAVPVALPSAAVELGRLPTCRRRDALFAAALFAVALALRTALGSHALIHENHHGYRYLAWSSALNVLADAHGVPSAHLVLVRLAGGGDSGAFALGAVLSAVAAVALAAYTAQVTRSRLAGAAAGALLALQPLAIALATTEEFMVSASALCLAGVALLHVGAARGLRATTALGVLCLSLAACAREITLPLAALAVPAMLSARRPDGTTPWRATAAVVAAMTALLLPQAARVVAAWRALPSTPGYMGAPNLPWSDGLHRNAAWVGWMEPYIPRAEGWAMVLALAALVAWSLRTKDARLALGAAVVPLIALAQGGLVRTGWFPTGLRHQLLSMAMLLIPVGWAVAAGAARLPPTWRRGALAAVVALAAVALWRRPAGYRIDAPHTREYRFFHDALATLPADGSVVEFSDEPLPHVGAGWVRAQRPRWGAVDAAALSREPPPGPLFLLLDRVCFVDPARFEGTARPGSVVPRATPFGRMLPECADALAALPWRTVAMRSISRATPRTYDIPSTDPVAHLAILRWDHP